MRQIVLFHQRPAIAPATLIGDGRPAGDHVKGASNHIAEDEGDQRSRGNGTRQLSALQRAAVFAQHIDLVDRRATGQQRLAQILLVSQRQAISGGYQQR